jgi:hypothetical protein
LHRRAKFPDAAWNDHQIATLRVVRAAHDLTYRSDRVDDSRSGRVAVWPPTRARHLPRRQRVPPMPGRREPCRTGIETINTQLSRIPTNKRFLLQSQKIRWMRKEK